VSVAYYSTPVHILCCYLRPDDNARNDGTIARLKHIVDRTLGALPTSKVVIVGDFNERLRDVADALKGNGITQVLPDGTKTHNRGGHLDQAFTNMPCGWSMEEGDFTDHSMIKQTIRFDKTKDDVDYRAMPLTSTMKSIREAATSSQTAEELLLMENCVMQEARMTYESRIKK